jgi:uncharacterized integral membrane protein
MSGIRPQRTRAAKTWVGIVIATVLLIALVVFIAQNNQSVQLSFFGADGNASLAVALIVAALGGAAIALLVGSVRIVQLRRQVRRAGSDQGTTSAQAEPHSSSAETTYPGGAAPGSAADAIKRGEARTEQARRM